MVKHCRTKRHIKIKSKEKVSLPGKMCLWFREGEEGEIRGLNGCSLKICCMWDKALRLRQFEGDLRNVSELCEISCKMSHKLLKVLCRSPAVRLHLRYL